MSPARELPSRSRAIAGSTVANSVSIGDTWIEGAGCLRPRRRNAAADRSPRAPFFMPFLSCVPGDRPRGCRRRVPSAGGMGRMVVSCWGTGLTVRVRTGRAGAGCARRRDGAADVRGEWPQLERGIRRSRRTGLCLLLPSSIKSLRGSGSLPMSPVLSGTMDVNSASPFHGTGHCASTGDSGHRDALNHRPDARAVKLRILRTRGRGACGRPEGFGRATGAGRRWHRVRRSR